jgi:cysteine desulfuration protein SufE
MNIEETQEKIVQEFEQFDNWEDKYSYLIKIGKELKLFPEEFRIDKYKLSGCQSQVWMNAKLEENNMIIQGDSDAMIVKGLVALLVRVYSGHSPKEILSSPPKFLTKIGIDKHLSPTRKNGLSAMLKQIQMFAIAFNTVVAKS